MLARNLSGCQRNSTTFVEYPREDKMGSAVSFSPAYEPREFEFQELAEATSSFSNAKLLGYGDFGDVYEGCLPRAKVNIAIKKLKYNQDGKQEEEFKNQIKDVGIVSHTNLVKLVGYCCEKYNRLLVSEFVPNKSLRFHLSNENGRSNLTWSKRMKIAIGSAKGLAHLHKKCNPKIIHQDIKSDNILLDNDFTPKVADFWLSKIFSEIGIIHIPSDQKEASIYKDSENSHFQNVTDEKSDVYSFGVLLLELITGRQIYEDHLSIVDWAQPLVIKGDSINVNYNSLVDRTLKHYDKSEMERIIYCVAAGVYSRSSRPKMQQIVETLEGKMPHKKLWVVKEMQSLSGDYEAYEPKKFTFLELARAADHFTDGRSLGHGGFGTVYRGSLPTGTDVAIKKLASNGQQQEEFEKEVIAVGIVRHGNLVKLVGYCNEEFDRLLVLEFVPNKSLRDHLKDDQLRSNLKWSERRKIAVGSAKGLAYLHEECNSKIIHRDIKAENILLENNYKPKIADFGLAKFFPETNSVTHISSHWKGTNVYADPENNYSQEGENNLQRISEKSDVYSLGVVLLELITGRKIFDEHQVDIVNWAKPLIIKGDSVKINYSRLVDSTLKGDYKEGEMELMIYCAAASIYRPSKLRPRMKQIVEGLEGKISSNELWVVEDVDYISRKPNELELKRPSLLKKFDFVDLATAARSFSEARFLRQQHDSCTVYWGVLPNSDQKVAIKRFRYKLSQQQKEEFKKEIMAISNVYHRNIVNLIGYCSDDDDKLLVYEFVPNNSLKFHLHENGSSTIDWSNRMKIAIGSAKGLKYMHEDSGHRILHLYIKSDNILLDDTFKPKLAEFGSAKIFPDSFTHLSISQIMKNSGYMAPEYQTTIKLTDKLDIYSFGVILLELITGKQPVGHFSGHTNMVKWAKPMLSKSLFKDKDKFNFVDEKLKGYYDPKQMDQMVACVLACVHDDPQRRPPMSQILEVLEGHKSLEIQSDT